MSTMTLPDPGLQDRLSELCSLPVNHPDRPRLRTDVIERGLPLGERLARRFANRGEPLDDLIQVARMALVKAVDGYDPARGPGFTSYAIPTILGELKRHFRDKGWSVRVPRRMQEAQLDVRHAAPELSQRLGRTPSVSDLAEHLGVPEAEVRAGLDCAGAYSAVSLSAPATPGSATELADMLGDPDPNLELVEARAVLRPLLARLPERERAILTMRYCEELTQSQIAARVDLSQMHVSRLISQTLGTLRGWLLKDSGE
ncbi:SigB/SigF/SigG family RNA polymerase sigma factor [Longispora urticae]